MSVLCLGLGSIFSLVTDFERCAFALHPWYFPNSLSSRNQILPLQPVSLAQLAPSTGLLM